MKQENKSKEKLLIWLCLILAIALVVLSIKHTIELKFIMKEYEKIEQHVVIPIEALTNDNNNSLVKLLDQMGILGVEIIDPYDIKEWKQKGKVLDVYVGAYRVPDIKSFVDKYCNCTFDYNSS
jgi:hypothetical protein